GRLGEPRFRGGDRLDRAGGAGPRRPEGDRGAGKSGDRGQCEMLGRSLRRLRDPLPEGRRGTPRLRAVQGAEGREADPLLLARGRARRAAGAGPLVDPAARLWKMGANGGGRACRTRTTTAIRPAGRWRAGCGCWWR